jgi:hypothetical protein
MLARRQSHRLLRARSYPFWDRQIIDATLRSCEHAPQLRVFNNLRQIFIRQQGSRNDGPRQQVVKYAQEPDDQQERRPENQYASNEYAHWLGA